MSRPTTLSIRLELLLPAAAIQNSKKWTFSIGLRHFQFDWNCCCQRRQFKIRKKRSFDRQFEKKSVNELLNGYFTFL